LTSFSGDKELKADMSEYSTMKLGRRGSRLSYAAAAVLLVALATGCHRGATSANSEPAPETKAAGESPAKPSATANDITRELLAGAEKLDSGKVADPSRPRPKLVRRKEVTAQFPDKTPQSTWFVDVYSDNSEVKHGPYTEFYQNGSKFVEGQYTDNKKDGDWKFWGTNGKSVKTESYRNGKLDGAWTLFREDGSKERSVSYKDGKRDGKWVFFDPAGKNQPVEQHEYKADGRDGTWIRWYPSGKKQSEEHYTNGVIDGQQTRWYASGKTQEVESFKNGLPDGKRIRWKENGDKINEVEFQNGHLVTADSSIGTVADPAATVPATAPSTGSTAEK
jgi:antitoxin component YwqK of YwqJK toxin-antitoxin module